MRDWVDDALCAQVGLEPFFPGENVSAAPAKKICAACDVREACLEWALAHDDGYGIFGGMDARERGRLRAAAA